METPDYKLVAAQLRQPTGEEGIKTAARMSENNGHMINRCIDSLELNDNDHVLEVGPGGGLHLPYLYKKKDTIRYTGVDISATMVALATENNKTLIEENKVNFAEVVADKGYVLLPYADNTFDALFTVNTIYFWDNAPAQIAELERVLKPGAKASVCFASDSFMSNLPFTKYDFDLYNVPRVVSLLTEAGLDLPQVITETEIITVANGERLTREFNIVKAAKR